MEVVVTTGARCAKLQSYRGFTMICVGKVLILKRTWDNYCNMSDINKDQWCGLRPSVLGQDQSETKNTCLGLAGLVLCCETHPCQARGHNLEGHSNFSSTIYSFSIKVLEHNYCGDQQWCSLNISGASDSALMLTLCALQMLVLLLLGRLPKVDLIILEGKNVRPSVRPSTKSFFDLNEIWYVGRGRWVMHDGMPYGRIQGQGHEPFKVWITSIFKTYLLRHLQWELASDH